MQRQQDYISKRNDRPYNNEQRSNDYGDNNRKIQRRNNYNGQEQRGYQQQYQNDNRGYRNNQYQDQNEQRQYNQRQQQYENRGYRSNQYENNSYQRTNQVIRPQRTQSDIATLNEIIKKLPIYRYRKEILSRIHENQVTIISGDTGCGKSTQVPKYIIEQWQEIQQQQQNKQDLRIICTQPRRIAAVNLAKRVSQELNVALGTVVGYQIGQDSQVFDSTRIIFMTSGIFLQRLIHEPETLNTFTHIILDEIHERDIESDFIMIILKHLLLDFQNIKLILMSATINAQLFAKYFAYQEILKCRQKKARFDMNIEKIRKEWLTSPLEWDKIQSNQDYNEPEEGGWSSPKIKTKVDQSSMYQVTTQYEEVYEIDKDDRPAPIISIEEQRLFTIYEYFLDTLYEFLGKQPQNIHVEFIREKGTLNQDCINIGLEIISHIVHNKTTFESQLDSNRRGLPSILVFLPGIAEIESFVDLLEERFIEKRQYLEFIPLHSTLSDLNQDKVFKSSSKGKRKIIIATNIAESSITIPDVTYVIDFCLIKEINYDTRTNMERLELQWASRASCKQRAGRAGRVSDGFSFKLVKKQFYEREMYMFSRAEIQRSPLDRVILRLKVMQKEMKQSLAGDPEEILGRAIQPPQLENIGLAIRHLQDCGALTIEQDRSNTGEATQLGKLYCDLPCDLRISKLIMMGYPFNCLKASILLGAILQQARPLFRTDSKTYPRDPFLFSKMLIMYENNTASDPITLLRIYYSWDQIFGVQIIKQIKQRRQNYIEQSRIRKQKMKNRNDEFQFEEDDQQQVNNNNNEDDDEQIFVDWRKIVLEGIYTDERKWCADRCLQVIALREVFILKKEIEERLIRFGLDKNLIKGERLDLEDSDFQERLKLMLACSFFPKFVMSFRQITNQEEKDLKQINETMDFISFRTVVITSEKLDPDSWGSDTLKAQNEEKRWRDALSEFGEIEKIRFYGSHGYVMFSQETFRAAIRRILIWKDAKASQTANQEDKSYSQLRSGGNGTTNNTNNNNNIVMGIRDDKKKQLNPMGIQLTYQFLSEILQVSYYHVLKFKDIFSSKKVVFDSESCNRFYFHEDSTKQGIVAACFDFQERGNKAYARCSTMLPDYQMLAALILLVVAPQPELIPDDNETRYDKVIVENFTVELEYYLTNKDVEDINKIRRLLSNSFSHAKFLSEDPPESLFPSLKNLLYSDRVKYIPYERWNIIFEKEMNMTLTFNVKKEKFAMRPQHQQSHNNNNNNSNNGNNRIFQKVIYDTSFLPQITKKTLKNSLIDQDKSLESIKNYNDCYRIWKGEIVKKIDEMSQMISMNKAYLVCGKCLNKICYVSLIDSKISQGIFRRLNTTTFGMVKLQFNPDDQFCQDSMYEVFKQYTSNQKISLFGCSNLHIVGFIVESISQAYITIFSNLQILYPDMTHEKFDFTNFDYISILKQESHTFENRNQILSRLECKICEKKFDKPEDFKSHLKNKNHQNEFKEFLLHS